MLEPKDVSLSSMDGNWPIIMAVYATTAWRKRLKCILRFEDDAKPRSWFMVEVTGRDPLRFESLGDAMKAYNRLKPPSQLEVLEAVRDA